MRNMGARVSVVARALPVSPTPYSEVGLAVAEAYFGRILLDALTDELKHRSAERSIVSSRSVDGVARTYAGP
jgi:hypothetical protein